MTESRNRTFEASTIYQRKGVVYRAVRMTSTEPAQWTTLELPAFVFLAELGANASGTHLTPTSELPEQPTWPI
jgi:hypothetical protein